MIHVKKWIMNKITIKALAKMLFQPCPVRIPSSDSRDAEKIVCFYISLNQVKTPNLLISLFTEGNFEGLHWLIRVTSDKLACFTPACGHTQLKSVGQLNLLNSGRKNRSIFYI